MLCGTQQGEISSSPIRSHAIFIIRKTGLSCRKKTYCVLREVRTRMNRKAAWGMLFIKRMVSSDRASLMEQIEVR